MGKANEEFAAQEYDALRCLTRVGSNGARAGREGSSLPSLVCPIPTSSLQVLQARVGDPAPLQERN